MYIYLLRPRVCVSFYFEAPSAAVRGGGDETGRRQNALRQEGQSKSVLLSSELRKNYNIYWKLLPLSLRREHSRLLLAKSRVKEIDSDEYSHSLSLSDAFGE